MEEQRCASLTLTDYVGWGAIWQRLISCSLLLSVARQQCVQGTITCLYRPSCLPNAFRNWRMDHMQIWDQWKWTRLGKSSYRAFPAGYASCMPHRWTVCSRGTLSLMPSVRGRDPGMTSGQRGLLFTMGAKEWDLEGAGIIHREEIRGRQWAQPRGKTKLIGLSSVGQENACEEATIDGIRKGFNAPAEGQVALKEVSLAHYRGIGAMGRQPVG